MGRQSFKMRSCQHTRKTELISIFIEEEEYRIIWCRECNRTLHKLPKGYDLCSDCKGAGSSGPITTFRHVQCKKCMGTG